MGIFLGIVVNSIAIVIGGGIGYLTKKKINVQLNNLLLSIMGIVVVVIGLSDALKTENIILVIISLVTGAFIGELLHLDRLIEKLSHSMNKDEKSSFHEGFITSTALFCIGAMTILGAVESGTGRGHDILFTKGLIDGITASVLAATLGIGVLFSSISTFIYTSVFIILAYFLGNIFSPDVLQEFAAVGGILLIAIGISSLLKIKEIKVINVLPSLVVIIVLPYLINLVNYLYNLIF